MFADTYTTTRAVREAEGRREKAIESMRFVLQCLATKINFVVSSPEGNVAGHSSFSQLHIYYLVCWYVTKIEPNLCIADCAYPQDSVTEWLR